MADKIPLWLPSEGALRTYTVGATTPHVTIVPDTSDADFASNLTDPGTLAAGTKVNLPNLKGCGRFAKIRFFVKGGSGDATATCTFKVYGRIRVDHQAHQIQNQYIAEATGAERNVYQWVLLREPSTGAVTHTSSATSTTEIWDDGTDRAGLEVLIDLEGVETLVAIPTSATVAAGTGKLQLRVLDK